MSAFPNSSRPVKGIRSISLLMLMAATLLYEKRRIGWKTL